MIFDAMVLAGGRSSRLGSTPKSRLVHERQTLLAHAINAVRDARRMVVVGDVAAAELPASALSAREEPPFGGPAAGIAAGFRLLHGEASKPGEFTIVIACDMPRVEGAVRALLRACERPDPRHPQHLLRLQPDRDGVIAVDGERRQPLAAAYRATSLATAIDQHAERLNGLPVFSLIAGLALLDVPVPAGSTDDVDTWDDAARFGIVRPD